jgi:hypothetical protein
MSTVTLRRGRAIAGRTRLRWLVAATLSASLAGFAAAPVLSASATTLRPAATASPCNATITAGSGTVVGTYINGVTAGSTQLQFDCNASSNASVAAEASLLGAMGSFAVQTSGVADTGALGNFSASASDTACPAGSNCVTTPFTIPATFTASDTKAQCPPTQAQINAGLFGCAIAIVDPSLQLIPGANFLVSYASQTTAPPAPTINATTNQGMPGSTIPVSDASTTAFWWGNAIQFNQATALGQAPQNAPPACGPSGGYGNVPTSFLAVNFFAQGSSTAIPGSASGVTISNDCYDSSKLWTPVLGGSIPAPSSLVLGTTYTAYLCELNDTPYPSNDASATTHCGAAPSGLTWVDASFSFTAANVTGTPQAALSVTSLSGTVGTPLTLATSGGSGTGAVTYTATDGTASGCTVSGSTLSASSAGTCTVTATKAADSTYLPASSAATAVTFAAAKPSVGFLTAKVKLTAKSKSFALKLSCSSAACSGSLSVKASVKVGTKKSTVSFGSASVNLNAGSSGNVTIRLSAAGLKYVKSTAHFSVSATVTYADGSGKYTKTGHVTLLK